MKHNPSKIKADGLCHIAGSLKLMHSVLSKRESAYLAHSSDVIPSISNAVRPAARSKAGGDTPSRELAAAANRAVARVRVGVNERTNLRAAGKKHCDVHAGRGARLHSGVVE